MIVLIYSINGVKFTRRYPRSEEGQANRRALQLIENGIKVEVNYK